MTIHFGLKLDNLVYPPHHQIFSEYPDGFEYCGPIGLLNLLEQQLGIPNQAADLEYIRIEQFRQALYRLAENNPDVYYKDSLTADAFATSEYLLARRDELLLAGWDFLTNEQTPERLQVLAQAHLLYEGTGEKVNGFADRLVDVITLISEVSLTVKNIILNEPIDLLPPHFRHLFKLLEGNGVTIDHSSDIEMTLGNDLGTFQHALLKRSGKTEKIESKKDGSLIIIKAERETDSSAFLTKLFRLNPDYQPVCLIPEQNRTLENSMIQEGLPAMGILSSSMSRPTLQILKLVAAFLWKPIDPYKILQFVSLTVKPLHYELGYKLANAIARSPGINSEEWRRNVFIFFKELEERAENDKSIKVKDIRFQYDFWFNRKRYDVNEKVPKEDVIKMFNYLSQWAKKQYDEYKNEQSLLTLSGQAKKVRDLLALLPPSESKLTALQIERIVRTIDEPSNVQLSDTEVGSLPFIHHHSAIVQQAKDLLWWNFNDHEEEHRFPKWYPPEIEYLESIHLETESPELEGKRLLWQRLRPIFQTTERLLLVVQERINGKEAQPHPLYGDLAAIFSDLEGITYEIGKQSNKELLNKFNLPKQVTLEKRLPKKPTPYLQIDENSPLDAREKESFSSLENLFYYPYKWAFRHKLKLKKATILSVVRDTTLYGNLAHKLFEKLLSLENILTLSKEEIDQIMLKDITKILETEGSTLLLYGREPERVGFLNKLSFAVHSLIKHITENGWTVVGTEMELEGTFMGVPVKGIADVVLEKGNEKAIIDLKWPNRSYLRESIRNREDLQLVFYSKLLDNNENWAHTAYYIIETGQLYARNTKAFKDANPMDSTDNHALVNQEIWDKMENTYQWRMEQVKAGKIEIRTADTADMLEEIGLPVGDLVDFLEMKNVDARFDDYSVLLR